MAILARSFHAEKINPAFSLLIRIPQIKPVNGLVGLIQLQGLPRGMFHGIRIGPQGQDFFLVCRLNFFLPDQSLSFDLNFLFQGPRLFEDGTIPEGKREKKRRQNGSKDNLANRPPYPKINFEFLIGHGAKNNAPPGWEQLKR